MGDVIDLGEQDALTRSAVVQAVYDFLADNMPAGEDGASWQPSVGALDDLLINGFGQQVDELATVLSTATTAAFRYLGLKVHKVAPQDPIAAGATTLWTNATGSAKTVDAGTALSIDGVAFDVSTAVTVPAGATAFPVPVLARDAGSAGNGLGASVIVRDNLNWSPPPSVALAAGDETGGGADGEDDETYLARLVDELQLLSRAAITTDDFARTVQAVAGVHRVLVVPRYDPGAPGAMSGGHVTVVAQNDAGGPVSSGIKDTINGLFADGQRAIVPVQVHVADPAPYPVSVTVTVAAWPGFTADVVQAQVQGLVADFLAPAFWGAPSAGDGDLGWVEDHVVSALAMAGAIERGDSVRRVTAISINGATDRADVQLGDANAIGVVPNLTTPAAVTVTS
jgi:hypothetical protein